MRSIEELRQATEDELIREHDALAGHTVVGTDYYVRELDRRSRDKDAQASLTLARRSYRTSLTSTWVAVVALVVAIIALFVR